jgi:hypothetical protein
VAPCWCSRDAPLGPYQHIFQSALSSTNRYFSTEKLNFFTKEIIQKGGKKRLEEKIRRWLIRK